MLASGGSASAMAATDTSGEPNVNPAVDPTALVHYRLEAQDASNHPISVITVGQDFQLVAFVQDVRTPTANPAGLFAGFLDVSYNSSVATISSSATINYGSFFSLSPSGDLSTPGEITGAGASAASLTAPGNAEQLLWKIQAHANALGNVTFTSSFDSQDGHDTLLYGVNTPIAEGRYRLRLAECAGGQRGDSHRFDRQPYRRRRHQRHGHSLRVHRQPVQRHRVGGDGQLSNGQRHGHRRQRLHRRQRGFDLCPRRHRAIAHDPGQCR